MSVKANRDYGRRLIPQILDSVAALSPERILYTVLNLVDGKYQLQHITASIFAKAVDKTAWWLQSQIGDGHGIRPVGYIGPHDLRHVLLTYAAAKAGCTALFLSPKNTVEGAVAVLKAAKCGVWIHPSGQRQSVLVKNVLATLPMQVFELPALEELLDVRSVLSFEYRRTFEDAADEPFCMLHTSGTTGTPKPISWTHALIGTMDAVRLLPPTEGDSGLAPWTATWNEADTLYSSFPMSHGAGIIMDILMPSLFDLRCVLGPVGVLPNMDLLDVLLDRAGIDIWSMVPSLVDELGESPDVLAKFSSAKFICASGGPVNPDVACKVNDVVRVLNLTGTTEGLFIGNLIVPREDWHWFAFHPYSGFEFKEVEPGVFEHWVHRNEHWRLFQGIFQTFPDKDSINLKDLYVQHPTKPGLWAFKGRSDDVVVLSNGYKISPLPMESYISTHPAVEGCIAIGTGKTRAGLLIKLKPDSVRNNELFDSIWEKVEESNALQPVKSRVARNDIAFAEPDLPFVKTDKGTVKRHATLLLYADFIERFYNSREEEIDQIDMDTSSLESILESLRQALGQALPEVHDASVDDDLFDLGLDSLVVFRVVNAIRSAMGLRDKLAPRHLYSNPTLASFSGLLGRLALGVRTPEEKAIEQEMNANVAKMRRMIARQQERLSFKMNPLDYVNPNHYMGINLFFPLHPGVSYEEAFEKLQRGLHRTLRLIPSLDGQMTWASEEEMGYKKGDLRLVIPPLSPQELLTDDYKPPRQLKFADLSDTLPSFERLQATGFLPSTTPDDVLLPCNPFPLYPADIVVAQANFVKGGCILASNFHHGCLDANGVMIGLKTWAESCRFLGGDDTATCDWLDPESANHSLPEILHDMDPNRRPIQEVDPNTWGFLPFLRPDELRFDNSKNTYVNGDASATTADGKCNFTGRKALPPPNVWSHDFKSFPPTPDAAGRSLKTTMFSIPPEKVEMLKRAVLADPQVKGTITSISDIVQAFFWRVAIRARYNVTLNNPALADKLDDTAVLEMPVDGRPYFSTLLPSSYMGSMLIMNRTSMPLKELCSPETSVGRIALVLREAAARINPSLFSDCFTLLRAMPHYSAKGQFSLADMGLDGIHAMISNMILFQPEDISFGNTFFAQHGVPEALRPQIQRGSNIFRFLVIHPLRRDGGIELVLGTLPEELEELQKDEEFARYATLADY